MSETSADFDVGPLSWVLPEIDQALARGLDALTQFHAAPKDRAPLRHAQAHVHQVAGAIQMVGLDAVVPFTDEIERGLDRLASGAATDVDATVGALDHACRKLKIFLAEVVAGAPLQALKLFPEYAAMQATRGIKAAAASDLFYPDLAARIPERSTGATIEDDARPTRLVRQRRLFQTGLLAWLRGDAEGAATMRRAVAEIEQATAAPGLRTFWWSVGALFDAIVGKGLEPSFGAKQLAARIDLQIRRVVEGSTKVADRLRREVLYYVAISAPGTGVVAEVQKAFRLHALLPPTDALSADTVRLEPLLRKGREEIVAAKDAWLKFASGRAENLPRLRQTMAAVRDAGREIGNAALAKLTDALCARLDRMPALNMPEALAMEYATGLLLAETAFDSYFALSPDFPRQVDAMLARLDAVAAKRPVAPMAGAPQLDEMSKRAQERLLLAQVVREIQVNLRRIEQVLDAFFRDHAKRGELASLGKDSRQIGGALRMLGLDAADQLLTLCQAQIDAYANPDKPISNDDLELLAEALSSLGFYVEAVEHERPDRERLITPLLERLTGTAKQAPVGEAAESVEAAVEEMRVSLPEIAAEIGRAPADAVAREGLRVKLADLRDDAELIGDETLAAQAGAALQELAGGSSASLTAAVDAIAESAGAAPAPEISEETQRLLATDQKKLDAEFVEIYLAEAAEVLDTIGSHRAMLAQHAGAPDALRTVRRGFHTLKGSGRMVGLDELGELAYDVEKILNRLLEEERTVTPTVLAMIESAEQSFRGWVAELNARGDVRPDPAAMHAAILAVEADLPRDRESVLARPAPARRVDAPAPAEIAPIAAEADVRRVEPAVESTVPEPIALAEPAVSTPLVDFGLAEVGRPGGTMPEVTAVGGIEDDAESPDAQDAVPDASAAAARADSDDVTIGEVTLSGSLYRILCDEADLHLATLRDELHAMQFDPDQSPTAAMVRASHTLHGIHRTAGFPLVSLAAKALEQGLLVLQATSLPLAIGVLPRLAEACATIESLVAQVKARQPFTAEDQARTRYAVRALEALRPGEGGHPMPEDAEVVAAREAADAEEREAAAAAERDAAAAEREAVAAAEREAVAAAEREAVAAAEREAAAAAEREAAAAAERKAAAAAEREAAAAAEREAAVAAERKAAAAAEREAAVAAERAAAAPAHPMVAATDPLEGIRDEVDEQVLPIFLEEAAELFPQAGEALRGLRRAPSDVAHARRLRRTLHTLKGSARMAGAMRLGQLTHLMESRLEEGEASATPPPGFFDLLETDLDQVAFVLDALRGGRINVPLPWVAAATAPEGEAARAGAPAAEATQAPATSPVVVPFPPRPAAAPAAAAGEALETDAAQRALLRVRADLIDRLVNEAGEVAIARSRIDGELRALKANLLELTSSVIRLRTQVREIEIQGESQIQSRMSHLGATAEGFDPLEFDRYTRFQELTRSLAEGVNDVATVQQALLKNLDDADAALLAQARYSRDIQQQLFAIRTVPFGSLSERLYRILRQTAKELDKRANLEIRGAQVELDRSVLEKLAGPLEHLLRNALDHGIEARAVRVGAGKSETGEIALTVRQVGNEISIELADDGDGLDFAQIRAKAIAQGLLNAADPATDAQLIECIFQPGFSTASVITAVSGRGIGMDVVRAEIAALGGRVEVATRRGEGTTFLLYLPLTLAVSQAVMVRAGGRLWALPAPMVEQVQQVKPEVLLEHYVARKLEWQGTTYPFHYLPRLLGDAAHAPETSRHNSVLLLRAGQGVAAVHVDEMVGNQEVVVKNIGPQLARVTGIAGATVLGNGEIVLIINPVQLAQRAGVPVFDPEAPDYVVPGTYLPISKAAVKGPPQVMIVDDSLTVRKITSRLLAREGFDVITAKDGVDAIELLEEHTPDVILLDIEMPRMDGFEFTRTIKADSRHSHIPIIMITSRTAEKHRSLARELGVDLYLGKPFQEEDLLRNLREMLALTP